MFVVALAVGLLNGTLVRFGRFTPVAATLTTYIALQGVALLLRPCQAGAILRTVADLIETRVGPIPIAFVIAVAAAIAAEWFLRRSRAGLSLRAVGSSEKAAHRLGVRVSRTFVLAYVVSGFFVFIGVSC
jgi:ribose transport system ATP-binding protein